MNKLSNLLCLTGCGFHDHLEKGGLVGPNMGTLFRVHELATLAISNIAPVRTKTEKTTLVKSSFATMLFSKTMYMKLHGRSHPDPETLQRGIL